MIDTNLIVIDGLSGSGKTTTAEWLTAQLHQQNIQVVYLPEYHQQHPLWWYEYWDGKNYLIPDFNNIPIKTFLENSLSKWRGFVDSPKQLVIAESIFFQDAVAMFLMGGATQAQLLEYAREVQQIAHALEPALIYFHQKDVSSALRIICAIRGQEFEDELVQNMESFPYFKRRKLKGLDGIVTLWQDIQALTDTLFEEYAIRKLFIDHSDGNWSDHYQKILGFIKLST